MMSCQEKCQQAQRWLKEVLDMKYPHFFNYRLLAKIQNILALLQTIITTNLVTYSEIGCFYMEVASKLLGEP